MERTVLSWLDSPKFFAVVVGLLVFQSLWIALSAVYPQAFDENFHFGLIQLHAEQWLPFFTQQPAGADIYGAAVRDPSYFYHYLMSYPYRLLNAATDSLTVQVVALRLLNIGLFVAGLYVFRRLLLRIGASLRMTHVVMFFFVLTPIVPLLAAQINYDNAIFLLTGLLFLSLLTLLQRLRGGILDIDVLLLFAFWGLLASIIKYTSTPVFVAATVVLAAAVLSSRRHAGGARPFRLSFSRTAGSITVAVLLAFMAVLAVERYGLNLARYHTPVPDCAQVLTVDQCKQYSPWARDHLYTQIYPRPTAHGIFVYPGVWAHRMVWETMFTVSSWFNPGSQKVRYVVGNPLTIANYTAWTLLVTGTVLVGVFARRLWTVRGLRILVPIIGFYTLVLFAKNFSMYIHTGEAVAIHGRYLIPVYPVLFLVLALGFNWLFIKLRRAHWRVWLVILTTLLLFQGGGLTVWLLRSEPRWYWPHIPVVQQANWWAKTALDYVIVKEVKL